MGLEWMDADWRRDLEAFSGEFRIGGNQIKERKELFVIAGSLRNAEQACACFDNPDQVTLSLDSQTKVHAYFAGATAARLVPSARIASFDMVPIPLDRPSST